MIAGTAYGVALNDADQCAALASEFLQEPYKSPPDHPVVYIKTSNCIRSGNSVVTVPSDVSDLRAGATIALLFGDKPGVPIAAALVVDLFEAHASYYRPAIRQHCRDGFLPMGSFASFDPAMVAGTIATSVDGTIVHRWSGSRLVRSPQRLIADLSRFMTLADGDILLIGVPGDAPRVLAGSTIAVEHPSLPAMTVRLMAELRG